MSLKEHLLILIVVCTSLQLYAQNKDSRLQLADPSIFYSSGTYYLYGTASSAFPQGFIVYTSEDLVSWTGPAGAKEGYALKTGDAFGTSKFWAPQVFNHKNKFYMAYTANEHVAIASADSPLGPFKQNSIQNLIPDQKQIDPYVFVDDDGKIYLYHVIVANGGNRINVVQLTDDMSRARTETLRECISVTDEWENVDKDKWTVTEGPTVFRSGEFYYMLYSANHFRSKDYAVGYAVSSSPMGPWEKYDGNPIISRKFVNEPGVGHGDLFKDKNGQWKYVLHTHQSTTAIGPRATAIVDLKISGKGEQTIEYVPETFKFLKAPKK